MNELIAEGVRFWIEDGVLRCQSVSGQNWGTPPCNLADGVAEIVLVKPNHGSYVVKFKTTSGTIAIETVKVVRLSGA